MSNGTIISLSIVALSIILLIVAGTLSYNNTKPTIRNFKELNAVIQQKSKYYTRESGELNRKVTLLSRDSERIQKEIQVKSMHIQDFTDKQGEFQSSIRYLQDHASEYSKGIATNLKHEVKEDGPKIMKSFKLAFKKTFQKQKARHKNK